LTEREQAEKPDSAAEAAGANLAGLVDEVGRIDASAEFQRAPVMRRLLAFLAARTLAGEGEQLKAYSVAVEGLGRPSDFDPQLDSYPRVQVGRLRRMIDAYYAQNPPVANQRLTIPSGGYRVVMETVARGPGPGPAPGEEPEVAPVVPAKREWWRSRAMAAALLLLIVAVSGIAGYLALRTPRADRMVLAPTLTLGPIRASGPDTAEQIVRVDAILTDALRRPWMIRLRTSDTTAASSTDSSDFRLVGEITGGASPTLYLRLWRRDPERVIWSTALALPDDPAALQAALLAPMVSIIQPNGVIATEQRATLDDSYAPGFPCLLQFETYRRERMEPRRELLEGCLAETLELQPRVTPAVAAQSFLELDRARLFQPGGGRNYEAAEAKARAAIAINPYSADAQFAMARVAAAQGQCARARAHGLRATDLNPYNPDIMAMVGRYLTQCGDLGGVPMIERAIALDPNPPAGFFPPLIYVALREGDRDRALALASRMAPSGDALAPEQYLALTVARAATGDRPGAAVAWQGVEAEGRPDAAVARWLRYPPDATVAMAALRDAGLAPPLPDAPPATATP